MARTEYELRNLPRQRMREYWIEAGGMLTGDLSAAGEGWRIWLEPMPPAVVGHMEVRRDRLIIEGDPDAVQKMADFMRGKTMRGGG